MRTRFARAFACTLFCFLAACQVHSQDAILKPRDFSTVNSVTLLLVEAQRGKEGVFGLQYDAKGSGNSPGFLMATRLFVKSKELRWD